MKPDTHARGPLCSWGCGRELVFSAEKERGECLACWTGPSTQVETWRLAEEMRNG